MFGKVSVVARRSLGLARFTSRFWRGGVLALLALLVPQGPRAFAQAEAPSLVVTTNSDLSTATDGKTSLREAITYANTKANVDANTPDEIAFDPTTFATPQSIALLWDLLSLSEDVTITGPGANLLTVKENGGSQNLFPFTVNSGVRAHFQGLTISGARVGIANSGITTVRNCTISGSGFGFNNGGKVIVTNCTLSDNKFSGIHNDGTVTVTNSTISRNGYGIFTSFLNPSLAMVTNSTISGNGEGIICRFPETVTVTNSIVAGNGQNLRGNPLTAGSANNITTATAAEAGLETSDGANAVVLKDNGGPTQTIALINNGTAINKGSNVLAVDADNNSLTTDQRGSGYARIQGGRVDIGAYELPQKALPTVTIDGPLVSDAIIAALPANITGTYTDNSGLTDVAELFGRLYRYNGGTPEYWNSNTKTWQSAVVKLPLSQRSDGTWHSTPNLPRNNTEASMLLDGRYGLTIVAVDKSGNVGSAAVNFRVLTQSPDTVAPVVVIDNPLGKDAHIYEELPPLSGTVSDNGGVFNIKSIVLRLRRFRSTPDGEVKEYWNPETQQWQLALVHVATTPARASTDKGWTSSGSLPFGDNVTDGLYCLTSLARDGSNNLGSRWVYFQIVQTAGSKAKTSSVVLSAASAKTDGTVTLVFFAPLDPSAEEAGRYDVVVNGGNVDVQSATLKKGATTVVLRLPPLNPNTALSVAYTLKDSKGQSLTGVARTTVK